MPITHNNLWHQIVDFQNFFDAFNAAASGKRYKESALRYRQHLEENIINTINLLTWKQWEPSRFREFYIHDPKKRLISAPQFRDRVVHHALYQVVAPLFEAKFIGDSYACRTGKGTHAAKERVESFAQTAHRAWGGYYVLKADISGYFYNINRATLMSLIERTIADKDVLWLIRKIVQCDGDDIGLPIGALTSQLWANVYLDALDHHLKDDLGVKLYARYMDDFVVIHHDKKYLQELLAEIERFLAEKLQLKLNPKTAIFKSGKGAVRAIDFCGYRIWPGYTKPRKRTVRCARRRLRKLSGLYSCGDISLDRLRASVMSFLGYMRHCNGLHTLKSVLGAIPIRRAKAKEE